MTVNYGYLRFMKEMHGLVGRTRSFAIVGNEPFFKRDVWYELTKALKKLGEVDEERFDADSKTKINVIDEALSEYPLIGKFRLIVLLNADKYKEQLKKLSYWFKDPTSDTKTIFIFTDDVKAVPSDIDFDVSIVCNDMGVESKEFDKYIDWCLLNTGKSLSVNARDIVKEVFANNIHLMKGELLKVSSFIGSRSTIDVGDLRSSLSNYPTAKVFDLVDCMVCRDLRKSFLIAEDLLQQGTDGTFLVYLLAQRLQVLQGALKAQTRGENLKEYFIRKKIPLFQFGKVLEGIRHLKEYHLQRYFDVLCEGDYQLRLSVGDIERQRLITEGMIIDLCR